MKIFLCGFGEAGEAALSWLCRHLGPKNVAVFTHPDQATGHGLERLAKTTGSFCTTESVNNLAAWPWTPDIIASVYYRTIIKQPAIDAVQGKIFNAHTSLLPRHRGRSPLSWAIIEGDQYTGVTFHYIDAGVDTGPVLMQAAVPITGNDTLGSLFEKVNRAVYDYFPAALELVKLGHIGIAQRGDTCHHPAGCPYGGKIDSAWPIGKIERFIRAMTYPPLPYATFGDQEIKTIGDYLKAISDGKRSYSIAIQK